MPRNVKSALFAIAVLALVYARGASAQTVDPPGGDPHGCVPVIGETQVSSPAWSASWLTTLRQQLTAARWGFAAPVRQLHSVRGSARLPQAILRKRH